MPEPIMYPYTRHVLVCTGGFCSPDRRGRALYAHLAKLLERENLLFGPTRVKRGETPCLGVCAGGPIVVVYPEGVWYAHVTPELLDRIVVEHLKHGRVVEDAVFHRLELAPAQLCPTDQSSSEAASTCGGAAQPTDAPSHP